MPGVILTALREYWSLCGIFTRVLIATQVAVNVAQRVWFKNDVYEIAVAFGFTLFNLLYKQEYYRIVTSEFTHYGVFPLVINMSAALMWGITAERRYGTIFYAFVNIWLALISQFFSFCIKYALVFLVPEWLVKAELLLRISMGYSNVLFGILTLECL
jgi:membrane associated rhomboid family serine protease